MRRVTFRRAASLLLFTGGTGALVQADAGAQGLELVGVLEMDRPSRLSIQEAQFLTAAVRKVAADSPGHGEDVSEGADGGDGGTVPCLRAWVCPEPGTGGYCHWGKPDRDDHPVKSVDWYQAGSRWVGSPAHGGGVGVRGEERGEGLDVPVGKRGRDVQAGGNG